MIRRLWLFALTCLVFGQVAVVHAEDPPISRVVVFGDSLSDTGNLYRTTIGEFPFEGPAPIFPIAFYPGGRFSNGPIWIEAFASHLNQTIPQPIIGPVPGTNFAFGGAETGVGLSQRLSPNVGEQVGIYANTVGGFAGDELVVVWGGGNDLNPVPPNTFPAPEDIVANTVTNITELHLLGGKTFLVPNLPPVGSIPQFRDLGPAVELYVNLLAIQHNLLLEQALTQLEQDFDITIYRFNVFGVFLAVNGDPGSFGFTNTTSPAFDLATQSVVANPDEYVFWDTIHPTTMAHQVLGSIAAATFTTNRLQDAVSDTSEGCIQIRGFLSGFIRMELTLRLAIANIYLQNGNIPAGVSELTNFRSRVTTLRRLRRLNSSDANYLIDQANVAIGAVTP